MNASFRRIDRAVLTSLTCTHGAAGACGEGERFVLAPQRAGAIKVALQASLQTDDAVAEVRRILQLIVAFDGPLGSPTVAEALRQIVRCDPDAVALIQAQVASGDDKPLPAFEVTQDQEAALRAAMRQSSVLPPPAVPGSVLPPEVVDSRSRIED